jgi:hypothetical protein
MMRDRMKAAAKATRSLRSAPMQSAPLERLAVPGKAGTSGGVRASQSGCEGLTGLAQQMCYAVLYGV